MRHAIKCGDLMNKHKLVSGVGGVILAVTILYNINEGFRKWFDGCLGLDDDDEDDDEE